MTLVIDPNITRPKEAVLYAFKAFPTHLSEDTDREKISLKYLVRSIEGKYTWVGLHVAKGSAEMWRHLVVNGSDVVEIGVVLGEKEVADMLEDDHGELTINGEPIKAFFNEGTGTQRVPGRIIAIPVPATYEVSVSLNF